MSVPAFNLDVRRAPLSILRSAFDSLSNDLPASVSRARITIVGLPFGITVHVHDEMIIFSFVRA